MDNPFEQLKGRQLMLCNLLYQGPTKQTDWHDHIIAVYKDTVLNKKETLIIQDPEIDIYVVKPEFRTFKKPRHFMSKDKLDVKTVKYKNVLREISKIAGSDYEEYYKTHTRKENRNMYKYSYVLGADTDIEVIYRCLWQDIFGDDIRGNISCLYYDIEVDQYYYEGTMAKNGEVTLNAFSMVYTDGTNNKPLCCEFLYDEPTNPKIAEFRTNVKSFYQKLHEKYDESFGDMDYKIFIVKDEGEMITQIFNLVKQLDADFVLGWNVFGFDINYIICRAKILGIDPASLFCNDEFPNKHYYLYDDKRTFEFANKRSFFTVASRSAYLDMIINYPSLRKSGGAVKKVSLSYISQEELKDDKIDYGDAGNIRTLPYNDFEIFTEYSMKDSMLIYALDKKTKDTNNIYMITQVNTVPYKDALKQTVVFRALMYNYLRKKGLVLGHNVNFDVETYGKYDENGEKIIRDEDDEDDSFEGALNGDTMLNEANGVKLYNDIPSMFLYKLVIDFDFSAMYPNVIVVFNIFATNMIGKIIIDYRPEVTYDDDMGKEYIEDVIAGDVLHIGHKWHNLSNFEQLNAKMKEKLQEKLRHKVA